MTKLPAITINPDEIETLPQAKKVISDLLNIIEELMKQVHQLSNDNQFLKAEVAKLKKQSKPPPFQSSSSTSQNYSTRKQTKQKTQWQKSAKKPLLTIDREEQLPEVQMCQCGSMQFRIVRTWNKIVQGLVIKRDTVKYNGRDKECLSCGKFTSSFVPNAMKGKEFASELCSWVSVFKFDYRMSEGLIQRFLTGVGVQISKGQITNILLTNSKRLAGSYSHLRIWGLKISQFVHGDATGFIRRFSPGGKRITEHLNFVGHEFLSLFVITRRYNGMLLATEVFTKKALAWVIYISDDAGANGRRLMIKLKQLCWVHEIRHYLKLTPTVAVHKQQVAQVIDQLWEWYKKAKEYGRDPTEKKKRELAREFDTIMNRKTGYQALDTRLGLTKRKRKRLLLFLQYPGIPIENNLAERDLRPVVLMRKLSGGTRSIAGDRSFERHMSVIQTARKQGLNVFETMHGLLIEELSPFILTQKTLPALTA